MKVLIADDDSSSRKLLGFLVTKNAYEAVSVKTGLEAQSLLEEDREISIAIINMNLPDMSGVQICRQFQDDPNHRFVYFIMTNSHQFQESHFSALDQGAHDIVYKPFQQNYLQARLDVGRRLILTNQRLETLALIDQLTGLCNRRAFISESNRRYDHARRHQLPTSLLYLDLDNLKTINDTHGHHIGDKCLIILAEQIKATFSDCHLSGRLGGDEFAILLLENNNEMAFKLAKEFQQAAEKLDVMSDDNQIMPINVSVSIGISSSKFGELRLDEMIKQADIALIKAKNEGKNCIAEWESSKKEASLLN